jgi:hypothetical protein
MESNAAILWDIALCSLYVHRRFGGMYHLRLQGLKSGCHFTRAGFLLDWFSILKTEVIRSSETSLHIRNTWRYIPEDGNSHNYRCGNFQSYTDGKWSTAHTCRFIPMERALHADRLRIWMHTGVSLVAVAMGNPPCPFRYSNSGSLVVRPVVWFVH